MRKIDTLLAEYSESHQNETNKTIHWICVPLIFWSILGFISIIPSPHFCSGIFGCVSLVSMVAMLSVTIFYLRLSWRLTFIMLLVMVIFELILYQINIAAGKQSWILYLAVFMLSWIGQFYGHKIEGKKPSFLKDLQFLLIGPVWLMHFIFRKAKVKY